MQLQQSVCVRSRRAMSQAPHIPSPAPASAASPSLPAPASPPAPSILQLMVSGALCPLARLEQDHGISLQQLALWLRDPENQRDITNLLDVLRKQDQFLLHQQQPIAIAKNIELITSATSEETSRKACADLLKARIHEPIRSSHSRSPQGQPPEGPHAPRSPQPSPDQPPPGQLSSLGFAFPEGAAPGSPQANAMGFFEGNQEQELLEKMGRLCEQADARAGIVNRWGPPPRTQKHADTADRVRPIDAEEEAHRATQADQVDQAGAEKQHRDFTELTCFNRKIDDQQPPTIDDHGQSSATVASGPAPSQSDDSNSAPSRQGSSDLALPRPQNADSASSQPSPPFIDKHRRIGPPHEWRLTAPLFHPVGCRSP